MVVVVFRISGRLNCCLLLRYLNLVSSYLCLRYVVICVLVVSISFLPSVHWATFFPFSVSGSVAVFGSSLLNLFVEGLYVGIVRLNNYWIESCKTSRKNSTLANMILVLLAQGCGFRRFLRECGAQ